MEDIENKKMKEETKKTLKTIVLPFVVVIFLIGLTVIIISGQKSITPEDNEDNLIVLENVTMITEQDMFWVCVTGCFNSINIIYNVTTIEEYTKEMKIIHNECSNICWLQYKATYLDKENEEVEK